MFGVQTYLIFLILYVVLNTLIKLRRGGNILIDWLSKLQQNTKNALGSSTRHLFSTTILDYSGKTSVPVYKYQSSKRYIYD